MSNTEDLTDIPNPDALGLIPNFEPPAGEEHPDERPSDGDR